MIRRAFEIGFVCLIATLCIAQGDAPELIDVPALETRIAALDSQDPMAYFTLAEEFASEIHDERGRAFARTLYVLAYELSRDSEGVPSLTRSVCLALAQLEDSDSSRRTWLLAIASLQDSTADTQNTNSSVQNDALEAIGTALSYYRAEEYLKARIQFNRPHAVRYIGTLDASDRRFMQEIISTVESEASCVVCQSNRTVRDRSATSAGAPDELCTRCAGNPGPRLTSDAYTELVRFEVELFNVPATSWSAQIDLDGGKPLREADPDQLAALYQVDPRATQFRAGDGGNWRKGTWAVPNSAEPGITPDS